MIRKPARGAVPAVHLAVLAIHLAVLALAGALLLWLGRNQWFASDDFDFVASRGLVGSPRLGLFAPHNEHWSTLPIVLWRGLFSAFGLSTYLPYLALLVAGLLVTLHLGWRAALRGGADPWVAAAAVGALALVGVGWENVLWAFQSAWMLSLALGAAAVLVAGRTGATPDAPDRLDALGWVAAVGALASSALGLPLVAAAALAALWVRGRRAALVTLGPPALAFLVWFLLAGRSGLDGGPPELLAVPGFVVRGLLGALGALAGGTLIGAVLAVALLGWLATVIVRGRVRQLAVPLALAAAAPLFLSLAGLGRAVLDPGASSPRYLHVVLLLLLPLLAVAVSDAIRASPRRLRSLERVGVAALALLIAVSGVRTIAARAERSADVEQAWRARVVAAAELAASSPTEVATSEVTADLTVPDALRMRARGELPAIEVSALRRAEARVLVGVGPVDAPVDGPAAVLGGSARVVLSDDGPGCREVAPTDDAPQLVLAVPAGGGFELRADAGARVQVQSDLTGAPVTRPRPLVLEAGRPQAIAVADAQRLVLTLQGPTRVCGLAGA